MRHHFGFQQTHTAEQVETALRGHLPPQQLAELANHIAKAARRRRRKGKNPGQLPALQQLLRKASNQPKLDVATEWYTQPAGGDPVEVILTSGDRAGQTVTQVPPGASFTTADYGPYGQLHCRPATNEPQQQNT